MAVNDTVSINPALPKDHPALTSNGGLAVVHRISLDGKTIWVKPGLFTPIYQMAASDTSAAAGQKGMLSLPVVSTMRKTTIDERD